MILWCCKLVNKRIINEIEYIDNKSRGIVHIALAGLLHGESMLVDHIRLIDVEDFNVVGQSFSTNLQLAITKGTLARDLEKFYVVADLSEVDFLVEHKRLLHEIVRLYVEAINDDVVWLEQELTTIHCSALAH